MVVAEDGLNQTSYELYGGGGNDIFNVEAGARVLPGHVDSDDADVINAHISASAVEALGQDGYDNGLLDDAWGLVTAAETQASMPQDAALFVDLRDDDDRLSIELDDDIPGDLHAFDLSVTLLPDTGHGSETMFEFRVYALFDGEAVPTPEEVFGQTTVDPVTGEITMQEGAGQVVAIVQLDQTPSGLSGNSDPDISINREVSSTQSMSLLLQRQGEPLPDAPDLPDTDRPADRVGVFTDGNVLGGTNGDDEFVTPDEPTLPGETTYLYGGGGDDSFEVSGPAIVRGGEGADTTVATVGQGDFDDAPDTNNVSPPFTALHHSAVLNLEMRDAGDAVEIILEDDVTGYIHEVRATSEFTQRYGTTHDRFVSDNILFIRTDSADPPDLTGDPLDWDDIDIVASIQIGLDIYSGGPAPPDGAVRESLSSSEHNTDPQITINREIASVQDLTV